jgi:hypothetical protein
VDDGHLFSFSVIFYHAAAGEAKCQMLKAKSAFIS